MIVFEIPAAIPAVFLSPHHFEFIHLLFLHAFILQDLNHTGLTANHNDYVSFCTSFIVAFSCIMYLICLYLVLKGLERRANMYKKMAEIEVDCIDKNRTVTIIILNTSPKKLAFVLTFFVSLWKHCKLVTQNVLFVYHVLSTSLVFNVFLKTFMIILHFNN